jgi:NodT family efflux transporter outer membrane factor (OMF) lipoprotein
LKSYRKNLTSLKHTSVTIGVPPLNFRKVAQAILLGLTATLFSGCASKRHSYDVPEIPLPAQYKNAPVNNTPPTPTTTPAEATVNVAKENKPKTQMVEWWKSFGNTELVGLIDRALANNSDLRIATERIAQAKTRVDQARAGMLPTLSAPIGMAIQAPGGSIGSVTPGSSNTGSQKSYQASLQGSWRPDIWGEKSSLAESAKYQLWQASFERDNVQRNMEANLAASYVEYLSLNDRLRVSHETEIVLSRMLNSLEKRVGMGDATIIDLDQQKASIFAIRATNPTMEQQREDTLTTIAFLVGAVPGSLTLSSDGLDSLTLPEAVPSLPSSLLLRRPDIRMAEARLLAADADIEVARARMLPPLDLSGQVGHSSLSISQLLQPSTLFWNAIGNLTISIFDGGKAASDKENAKAVHEEMVETYARTIYQAAREVENALAAIRLNVNRITSQQEATTSARRAWDSSAKVYAVGGLDYQALLDAERNYHHYLDDYLRIKMESYHGYISLFQALGGGVKIESPIPGKGKRPILAKGDTLLSADLAEQKKITATDEINLEKRIIEENNGSAKVENAWLVELPGQYHRSTIGSTWRDLLTRYPKLMENRVIRPIIAGKKVKNTDGPAPLFHLYVSKFSTQESANELCSALKVNYQRCRVVSSLSEEVAAERSPAKPNNEPAPAQPTVLSGLTAPGQAVALPEAVLPVATKPAVVNNTPAPAITPPTPAPKTSIAVAGLTTTAGLAPDLSKAKPPTNLAASPASHSAPTALTVTPISDKPADSPKKQDKAKSKLLYTVQLGTFPSLENAASSHAFWRAKDFEVYVSEIKDTEGKISYAVRTGIFPFERNASALAAYFKRREGTSAEVVQTSVDKTGAPDSIDISSVPAPTTKGAARSAPETINVIKLSKPDNAGKTTPPKVMLKTLSNDTHFNFLPAWKIEDVFHRPA